MHTPVQTTVPGRTRQILAITATTSVVCLLIPPIASLLALSSWDPAARPWTVLSYMLVHGSLWHLLANLLGVWVLAPRLEAAWGGARFLAVYIAGGVAGAIAGVVLVPEAVLVGASAGVFALLAGFALRWPDERMHLLGVLPVRMRWLALVALVVTLWGTFLAPGGDVAHYAHLAGGLVGVAAHGIFAPRKRARSGSTKALNDVSARFGRLGS